MLENTELKILPNTHIENSPISFCCFFLPHKRLKKSKPKNWKILAGPTMCGDTSAQGLSGFPRLEQEKNPQKPHEVWASVAC